MKWLKGLIGAFIGGSSNAITLMIVDPMAFNLHEWKKLLTVALVSGIVAGALYVQKSPIFKE